jgi:hypothetical protein
MAKHIAGTIDMNDAALLRQQMSQGPGSAPRPLIQWAQNKKLLGADQENMLTDMLTAYTQCASDREAVNIKKLLIPQWFERLLHDACSADNLSGVKLLLSHGASLRITHMQTALGHASVDIMEWLVARDQPFVLAPKEHPPNTAEWGEAVAQSLREQRSSITMNKWGKIMPSDPAPLERLERLACALFRLPDTLLVSIGQPFAPSTWARDFASQVNEMGEPYKEFARKHSPTPSFNELRTLSVGSDEAWWRERSSDLSEAFLPVVRIKSGVEFLPKVDACPLPLDVVASRLVNWWLDPCFTEQQLSNHQDWLEHLTTSDEHPLVPYLKAAMLDHSTAPSPSPRSTGPRL